MASTPALPRSPWTVILCAATIVTLSMGVRQAFGLFLPQMSMELSITRTEFGLALAIQHLLFGIAQPFVGALADRHGAGRIAVAGALLYAAGLIAASMVGSALGLHLTLGTMVGVALAGITFTVMLGAVGRAVPPERRSLAFGIVTAGGSLGQFLVVPGAQKLLGTFGYHETLIILAAIVALVIPLALGIAGKPAEGLDDGPSQTMGEALREASGERSFWLLNAGFFVCGFHVAFIATHFPAYANDKGLDASVGASALALIGLFNIFGSYVWGLSGDKFRKHYMLALLYGVRAAVIVLFLALPLSNTSALIFAAAMGFLWLGTVPLTNGLVSQIFGVRYLSMLGGIVFLSHQVGSFIGAWAAGWFYDRMGNYDAAWMASIALGVIAAIIHLPIKDAPLVRQPGPALA